jgi:3,4-dihydroxy-2-butanone 4-phosphate synthase
MCGLASAAPAALTCGIVSPADPARMIGADEVGTFAAERGLPVVMASQVLRALDATSTAP